MDSLPALRQREEAHHPFSPSSLGRIMLCPGSHRMARHKARAPQRNAEHAETGTRLHAAVSGAAAYLDEEERALVARAAAFLARVTPTGWETLHETPLSLRDPETGAVLCSGTADFIALSDTEGLVVDLKFGHLELPQTSAGAQVGMYSAMASQQYGRPFRAMIYQPRLDRTYTMEDPPSPAQAILDLRATMDAAERGPLVLSPSMEACQYCPVLSICHAPPLAVESMEGLVTASLTNLDGQELGELGEAAKTAEGAAKAVLKEIKSRLKDRKEVPGWRIVERKIYALVRTTEATPPPEVRGEVDQW